MDYTQFVKKLRLPDGFASPTRLVHDDVVATAITRADLSDDVHGINASIGLSNETRGGGWPTEAVTEAFNEVDLVWHELESERVRPSPMSFATPTARISGVAISIRSADGRSSQRSSSATTSTSAGG